jgi:hypothetical protein
VKKSQVRQEIQESRKRKESQENNRIYGTFGFLLMIIIAENGGPNCRLIK